jgi:hypothetical protein
MSTHETLAKKTSNQPDSDPLKSVGARAPPQP